MAKPHVIGALSLILLPQNCAGTQLLNSASQEPAAEAGGAEVFLQGVQYLQPGVEIMPPEQWKERWDKVVNAGNAKGCRADLVQVVPRTSGFGAKVFHRVTSMWMAMLNPNISYAWDGSGTFDEAWWSYFENQAGIATPTGCGFADTRYLPDFDYGQLERIAKVAAFADHHYMAALMHYIVKNIWTMKPDVHDGINAKLASALGDGFAQGNYIGVHIRRGDKAGEAEPTPTNVYVDQIRKFSSSLNIKLVFVASDDPNVVDQVTQMLAGEVAVVNIREAAAASRGGYDDDAAMRSLLADVTGLQNSKVFIGTSSSTLGRLVYWLRGDEKLSMSLDSTGDFLTSIS